MRRIIGLVLAEVGLIFVRATTTPFVPIWSFWWWVWIIATVLVAWCGGMVTQAVAEEYGWRLKVKHRRR